MNTYKLEEKNICIIWQNLNNNQSSGKHFQEIVLAHPSFGELARRSPEIMLALTRATLLSGDR